jgi:protein-disulfide isomerase
MPMLLPLLVLAACALPLGACKKTPPEVQSAPANPTAQPRPENAPSGDTTPPPGVDMSQLDEFERKVFFRIVNKEPSACGKAHSLLQSVKTDPACRKSVYAVKYVARLIDAGYTDSEIAESLGKRFRAEKKTVETADAPMKGSPSARITLVEFVDYECPHCKRVQPVLRQVLEEFKNDVKLHFKHYPLGGHTNARLAAEATMAANKQGKFWAYNDKVWHHAEALTPAVLEQIAKEVGLDVAQWRKDLESEEIKARVQRDRSDGDRLGIRSTPTIYINGREFSDQRDVDSLRDWINEELGR